MNALETLIKNEKEKLSKVPLRSNTKLWWAETKQGQFCFELDDHYEMVRDRASKGRLTASCFFFGSCAIGGLVRRISYFAGMFTGGSCQLRRVV